MSSINWLTAVILLSQPLQATTLQYSGDLTLEADNIYEVEILGSSGTQHDQIQSSGNIAIDGGLQIKMADFVPNEGDTFTILTADSITGTFATIAGAEVGNGLVLEAQYTATSVTLEAMPGAVSWVNTAGGNWSDPANWSTAQVPGPCSRVMIDLDGSYQIDLDAPVYIWSFTLGASSGNQSIETNDFDIAIQDGSTIGINGTLQLNSSRVISSVLACRSAWDPGRLGAPGLVNHGKIEASGGALIRLAFGNTGEIVVSASSILYVEFGFVNDGTIKLSSTKPAGGDSNLQVGFGTLANNGTIQAQGNGGARRLYAPLDNHGQLEVEADLTLHPVQTSLLARIEAQLAPDEHTLAHYSFDEPTGLRAFDRGEQEHLPLTSGALPAPGAIKGARLLNGINGEIDLSIVRDMLEQEESWSISWYTRTVDDNTPALQMMSHYFAPEDSQLIDGYWHQYALSWEGQTLTLYRDGKHSNTQSFADSEKTREELAAQIRAQIYLGRDPETGSYQAGLVDELRITRGERSPEQNATAIEMLAIVNDWETSTRLNEPEGVRLVWLDAVPVTVLSENSETGELYLYSRLLDQGDPQAVFYMTHEGSIGSFTDYTLNVEPEEKYTYRLTGTRVVSKRDTPDFNNFGTLTLSGNADLSLFNGAMYNRGSGVIQGDGTVDITSTSLHNEGLLSAGASPGTLNIEGDISFGSTSTIHVELAGTTAGSGYDVLNISGTASLDGVVNVDYEGDYIPSGEEQYEVVNFTSSSGTFTAVNLPSDPPGVMLTSEIGPTGLVIEAEPVYQFQYSQNDYTAAENEGTATITVERVGSTIGSGTVLLTTQETGSARAGEDYEALSETLNFPTGTTSVDVELTLLDDRLQEGEEMMQLNLSAATGGTIGQADAPFTITDYEEGQASFQMPEYTVDENNPTAMIEITRVNGSDGALTANFSTADGSATAGLDYTALSQDITFEAGSSGPLFVNVTILEDTLPELGETVNLTLSDGQTRGAPVQTAQLTIEENDALNGELQFTTGSMTINEASGTADIEIVRVNGSGGAVTIDFETFSVAGGATPGEDYSSVENTLQFDDGSVSQIVMVDILEDDIIESDESFGVQLTNATGGARIGQASTAMITIADNERKRVTWARTGLERTEGTSRTVKAMLDSPAEEAITVEIEVSGSGNTATQGEDFTLSASQLLFLAGTTEAEITITLQEDEWVEGTESAILLLLEGEASVGDDEQFELMILDNDESTVTWSDVPSLLQEGEREITAWARLSKAYQDGVTVQYQTAGDASEGQDYRINTQTLDFGPGQTDASTSINLLDDTQAEPDETLELILLLQNDGPQPGASHTLTIVDDDIQRPVVNWTEANSHVTEGDEGKRSIAVAAELSHPFEQAVSVNYEVVGLATPGEDHNLNGGTLHYAAGETLARLEFEILGDPRQEPDENIAIRLSRGGDVQPSLRDTHNVIILDDDQGLAPETTISIVSPIREGTILCVRSGEEFRLQASATDLQSDSTFTYTWEICTSAGCAQTQGEDFTQSLDLPGTYRVTCIAEDNDGNADPTPATLRFQVKESIPPIARIVELEGRRSDVLQGGSLELRGEASNPLKRGIAEARWYLQGRESAFETGDTVSWTFPEAGDYTLIYQASNSDEVKATDHHKIHVYQNTAPTRVTIEEPANGTKIDLGESISLVGSTNSQADLTCRWDLGDGTWANGQEVDWTYDQPGRRQIRLFTFNAEGECVNGGTTTVYVRDPAGTPAVTFGFPTGVRLEPDTGKNGEACLFLSAIVLDDKGYDDLSFFYDVPGGQLSNQTPGLVCFPGEGTYTVSLYAVTPPGQQSDVVTRTVTVKAASDEEFEPNDSFAEAASVTPGQYRNLSLDEDDAADTYLVAIAEDDQRLVFSAEVVGEAILEVFDTNHKPVGKPRTINGTGKLQLDSLPAGSYYLRISQPDASKRRGLGFSLSIGVLVPTLFFADIRSDESFDTSIGVVNPSGEIVCIEVVGFGADGSIIGEVPLQLKPKGRQHCRVSELFVDLPGDVSWIQVNSVGKVLGYAHTSSNDAQELYATSASTQLYSELHAPHIGKEEQWFTRVAIVNGTAAGIAAKVETPTGIQHLELGTAFAKESFKFGGSLPAGPAWARMYDENKEATLVGIENFGTHDGSRISAGLALSNVRRDNPNSTSVQNNLYFTHIAHNSDYYTELVLVNLGGLKQGVDIRAYQPDGSEVGTYKILLAGNEKVAMRAEDILAELETTTAEVAWILAEADANIVGFELFGTNNKKQLAGLEASRALSPLICYPFVDTDPNVEHRISVLNVNEEKITVTFTLYDNDGSMIGESLPVELEPNQKYIGILTEMFPNIGINMPGWLKAESSSSDRPLAGFELFLNTANGEQMGAIIAQ